jgi:hypothetical protein
MNSEAFDAIAFEPPALLPAELEAFSYPAPAVLDPGTPGRDRIIALELYPAAIAA